MRRFLASAPGALVCIRLAYWLGTAYTILWAPVAVRARDTGTPYGAYGEWIFRTFDRWDSRWFVRIAEHGYATKQSAAFLPIYPMLVRGAAWIFRSHIVAGVVISLAAAAGAAVLLERIARRHLEADDARTAVLLVAVYPAAFVFTAAYSDALFLLFVLAAVDAAERRRPLLAGVAGALAVDTRLLGLALVPLLAILLWPERPRSPALLRLTPILLLPAALVPWFVYLHAHYGDALASTHAEETYWRRQTPSPAAWWHELRTFEIHLSNLVHHLPALAPGDRYPDYVVVAAKSVFDLAVFVVAVVLSVVVWRRLGAAFGSYSFATLAIVAGAPTIAEPLVSVLRFVLADFPLFIVGAMLLRGRPRAREIVLVGLGAVGAVTAVAFAHGVGVV